MGWTLPSPDSPAQNARTLMARKDAVEAELETQAAVLRENHTNMSEPLIDREGFPRADLDIWAVRHARVRIIELRNDLKALIDEIGKALESVYDRSALSSTGEGSAGAAEAAQEAPREEIAFAKVNGIAPRSPAADSGLLRDDLVLKFGDLRHPQATLQPLAELVSANENKSIPVVVQRSGTQGNVHLRLTPRQGWGGRGMLGCHLVPYTPS